MEEFKTLTREELKDWLEEEEDFVLIDVLSEESYESRHLPTAKHASVSESDFVDEVDQLAPNKNKPVVVYCASFDCQLSPKAAGKLVDMGYTDVYDFEGGLADWLEAGYDIEGDLSDDSDS